MRIWSKNHTRPGFRILIIYIPWKIYNLQNYLLHMTNFKTFIEIKHYFRSMVQDNSSVQNYFFCLWILHEEMSRVSHDGNEYTLPDCERKIYENFLLPSEQYQKQHLNISKKWDQTTGRNNFHWKYIKKLLTIIHISAILLNAHRQMQDRFQTKFLRNILILSAKKSMRLSHNISLRLVIK